MRSKRCHTNFDCCMHQQLVRLHLLRLQCVLSQFGEPLEGHNPVSSACKTVALVDGQRLY
jgi:hypothetical protein